VHLFVLPAGVAGNALDASPGMLVRSLPRSALSSGAGSDVSLRARASRSGRYLVVAVEPSGRGGYSLAISRS
jgi:hypothetical protein